ncbi:hypothetical protein MTO96_042064 [Rhipicephalus appendiculatus]
MACGEVVRLQRLSPNRAPRRVCHVSPASANVGSKPHHSDEANADRGGRQSTLSWANRVRKSTEFEDDGVMHCDLPPEENRDNEIARLKRENADLKETVNAMSRELEEIQESSRRNPQWRKPRRNTRTDRHTRPRPIR